MSPSQSTDGGDDDYTPSHLTRSRAGQFDPAAFATVDRRRRQEAPQEAVTGAGTVKCEKRNETCTWAPLGSPGQLSRVGVAPTPASDTTEASVTPDTRAARVQSTEYDSESEGGSPKLAKVTTPSIPAEFSDSRSLPAQKVIAIGSPARATKTSPSTSSQSPPTPSSSLSNEFSRMLQGPALPSPPAAPVGTQPPFDHVANETRRALIRVLLFGRDAPFEKVKLTGSVARHAPFRFTSAEKSFVPHNQVETCDSAYAAAAPNGPPILFSTSRVPGELYCPTGPQAQACISTYFNRLEPSLELFSPETPGTTLAATESEPAREFLRHCSDLWTHGSTPKMIGWASMYLGCLAVGARAMTEAEWAAIGCTEDKAKAAVAWLEEAGRLLVDACFFRKPSLAGLRACLLILHSFLIGLNGPPDVPLVLEHMPVITGCAYELRLHIEPLEGDPLGEERSNLWQRLVELQAMWAPLLDKQLAIDPVWSSPSPVPSPFSLASSSASLKRKRPASGSTASTVTPSSRADTSPLQAILELSCKSHSIAVASATPSSSKIKSLRAELDQLSTRLRDKLNTPPLAKLLLEVEALTDEIGGPRDASLEGKWSTSASRLISTNPLAVPQVSHLLATTAFLHGLILIALRLRERAPVATGSGALTEPLALQQGLARTLDMLRTAAWPLPLHEILQRGIAVLETLLEG
ncbi:hypothetical protein BMF94_1098 [Rhodotorula taiwanensis]|uniref:Transcription factor domain-containing protein n=1 Tax=Rhodotorula taiwanensis TaxID=741276 RepID=A0A2S5BG85_9BASI|nr:hypothetical protein BMF94_1098 [Rhodotorula taiwanensis]